MYLIVIGAGKIGTNFINLATRSGDDIVVVEQDRERANELAAEYDCLVIQGDATSHDILEEAGVARADAVVSTTNIDAVNIMVMLMAQEHDVPSLVSVVHDPDHLPVFNKIGVTLIENPQRLIADQLYHSVRFPGIEDFIQLGENIELIEVSIEAHSPAANHSLSEINEQQLLPESCLLVLVKRDDTIVTPRGTTTLQEDDLVTAICNEADLSEVVDTLHGSAA